MKITRFAAALVALAVFPAAAYAAADTTVAVGGAYSYAEPYILTAFGVIFSGLFGWACAIFQKRTGVVISNEARAAVNTAAMNAAGRILASQEPTFANMKIDVRSPLIAAEIPRVAAGVKAEIDHLGMTPDRVSALIAGKVGQLQAQALSGPAAPQ